MIRSRIKAFYNYEGPTKSDPFRQELSQEQVEDHLGRFPDELQHALSGPESEATVRVESFNLATQEITVAIECDLAVRDYDNALKRTLNSLDLFADQQEFSEAQ